jgi:hypothetical protein
MDHFEPFIKILNLPAYAQPAHSALVNKCLDTLAGLSSIWSKERLTILTPSTSPPVSIMTTGCSWSITPDAAVLSFGETMLVFMVEATTVVTEDELAGGGSGDGSRVSRTE